jgi:hypothetical protein
MDVAVARRPAVRLGNRDQVAGHRPRAALDVLVMIVDVIRTGPSGPPLLFQDTSTVTKGLLTRSAGLRRLRQPAGVSRSR